MAVELEPIVPYSAPINSEPRNDINTLASDIHRKVEMKPLTFSQRENLYSMQPLEPIGADNRLPTVIHDVDSREAYDTLSDGELISRYKNFIPGTNNEERLAQQQSTGEKWKNGWIKLAGKVGTSVIGGTVGAVNGVIQGITQGSISAVFDNDFNTWLDDLNKRMDYNLPHYYTQQERDYSLARQMLTANFWADEVFQGLSFTLGMLVSEGIWAAATGGTSLVARGLSAGALRALSKNLGRKGANQVLNAHKKVGKDIINKAASSPAIATTSAKQAVDAGRAATTRAGRIIDTFHKGRVIMTSSAYEGGVEARHYMMEAEEEFKENFMRVHGRRPSVTELSEFRNNITNSANAVFASNIALVGSTNLAVFGRALLGTRATGTFKNNWFKNNILGVGYRKEGAKIVAKEATKSQKIASKTYDILRPMFAEGVLEEGGQSMIAGTAKNYMLSAYDPDSTTEAISFVDALHEAFSDTFYTKEGQKEILIGALIGIAGGGMQSGFRYNETSQQRKAIEDMAKYYNAFTAENLLNNVIYNNKAKYAAQMTDEAIQNGDRIGGEIGNDAALVAKIERDYAFEGVEQGKEDFAAHLRSNVKTIMDELNLSEKEALDFIDEQVRSYSEFADEYVKNREFAETVYGTTEFAEFENADIVRDNVVRAVSSIMTIGKNADLRATETIKEIQELIRDRVSTTEAHKSLAVADALRKAGRNAHARYMRASNRLYELDIQLEKVRNKVAELNQHTDMSEAQAEQRAKLVQRMIELEEKVKREQAAKLTAYNALNLKSVSDENITQEDLDNQKDNFEDLQRSLRALEGSDSVLFNEIQQKYNEYGRAVDYAEAYLRIAREMMDPQTKMREINNYAARLFSKNATLKEGQQKFFTDVVNRWATDNIATTFIAQEQVDTQTETDETEGTIETQPGEEAITPKEKVKTQEEIIREELDTLEFDPESKRFRTNRQILPARINTRKRAQKYVRDSYKEGFSERIGITEEEFQNFVDTGQTTPDIIEYLAEKSVERAEELTPQEQDMFNSLTSEINEYFSNKLENTVIESLKAIREKIQDLINNNAYTKLYRGESLEEMAKSQPSKEDINRYSKYLQRLDREDIDTINRYQDYTPLEDKGFTEEEIDDFVELSSLLGEWYILEGISEGGNSVADLLILMEQYQMQAESLGIKIELDTQDFIEVKKSPDDASARYNSSNPVQTPDKVKVKLVNGKYEISHLNINSLEGLIPGATVQKINKKGELEEVDPNNIYNEGDKYKLTLGEQSVILEIGPHSRIITEKGIFDSIISDSNIRIVNYGSNINFDMYVRPEEGGNFVPLQGDFYDQGINPDISSEVQAGDIVHLEIDTNNPYNKQLIKKIKRTKNEKEKKRLIGQLVIYTKTENGESFGQLRAFHERLSNNSSTSKLIEIRDNAYKAIEAGETGVIDLGYRTPVANTLLGSPNFVVVEEADGTLRPATKEITPEMMKTVKAAGVYQNGRIELNDKRLKDVNTFFLRGLDGEVPIVVFEFKGKNVAFPLALKKTTVDHSGRLSEIDTSMGVAQQIIEINKILIDNGINPYDYQLDPTKSLRTGENLEVIKKIAKMLENVENFADINTWKSQSFDVSLLSEQAETYIDLSNEPFDSSKVILRLSETKVADNASDVMKNVFEGTETIKPVLKSEKLKKEAKKNQPKENC